ncbi:hypothetical protein FHX06_005977 [Rhizobium sp. BK512]|uniref:hypothetical protein n=1 Tax=Rhizobium sp. BK512 TaxID=2587010 RepID=UPI0016093386|nr:hypothetical protein [Rhizobium sp. BK512]MBB3564613.1 hypothetical protein [Rhizobium sp. BK512]
MNDKTEEEVFDGLAEELEAEKAIKNRWARVVLAMLAIYSILVLIAYFFLAKNAAVSCAFVDSKILMQFWPPNTTIMNALNVSRYSQADRCLFVATRSFASMTMLPAVLGLFISQLFSSDRSYIKGYGAFFILLVLGFFVTGFIGPSDTNSRYGMNFTSSIGRNIWVSMIHIFGCYGAAFMAAFQIPASIRSFFR